MSNRRHRTTNRPSAQKSRSAAHIPAGQPKNYARQTQFPQAKNQHNLYYAKELCAEITPTPREKTNPIPILPLFLPIDYFSMSSSFSVPISLHVFATLWLWANRSKQTQFPQRKNNHNCFNYKDLQSQNASVAQEKQTQSNPNLSRRHTYRQLRVNLLEQPGHVLPELMHCFQAFFVAFRIAFLQSEPDVPVR